ncbi:MAG TPA: DUF5677 domain-containing protein [Longimicrobium sp.]|jgi:hypothetical protein
MDESNSHRDQVTTFEIAGGIGQADMFARAHPASLEGPGKAWDLAKTVIDHGGFMLLTVNDISAEHTIRDSVMAALLRRTLITAEGVRLLIANGLEESAFALMRTLVELKLNAKLLRSDPSDNLAHRLAAYHFLHGMRQQQRVLDNADTRAMLKRGTANDFDWTINTAKRLRAFFESENFDNVREASKTHQHWHGKKNIEEAFECVGSISDYLQIYSLFSPFVHAANPEADFADVIDGKPALKPLVQRDPSMTIHLLGGLVLTTLEILRLFIDSKEGAKYDDTVKVTDSATGESFMISGISALEFEAATLFEPFFNRKAESRTSSSGTSE